MIENKKTALGAVNTGGGERECGMAADGFPGYEFTIQEPVTQGGIATLLPRGAENAVSTRRLVLMAGCSSARQLQQLIAGERDSGEIILSLSSGGYFRPSEGDKGRQEIKRYIATLRARALNTLRALRSAKAALRVMEGQESIDFNGKLDAEELLALDDEEAADNG